MHKSLVIFFSVTILVHFGVGLNPDDIPKIPQATVVARKAISIYQSSEKTRYECAEQLGWFLENLENSCSDNWAMQMIDASAKVASGVIGQQNLLGQYAKCLSIKNLNATVKGQYCLVRPTFKGDPSLKNYAYEHPYTHKSIWNHLIHDHEDVLRNYIIPNMGICIPDKCNQKDLALVLNTALATAKCQTYQKVPIDLGTLMTIGYFGFFVMLMFTSTVYDLLTRNGKPHPLLLVFSIRTNCKKLFSTKKNPQHFQCVYGLKVIGMIWVLAAHNTMTKLMVNPFSNNFETDPFDRTFDSIVFVNALNSADTFLMITGCLVVYNYMKMVHKGNLFRIGFYYTRKYLRLTFPIIPMLLSTIFLTKYISNGPFTPDIDRILVEPCKKYWWSNLLFMEVPNRDQFCLLQTWYLNVDWQLYQITPIFLYLVTKYPKFGLGAMVGAILSSVVMSFMDVWTSGIKPDRYVNIHTYLYYFTSIKTRAATWFLGCILGYFLARIKLDNRRIRTNKWINNLTWLIILIEIPIWIGMGIYRLLSDRYDPLNLAVYNAIASIEWGLCIAWIIFACSNGIGGIVNRFLSLPVFQILSRFVFSAFIVHLNIMFIIAMTPKETIYSPAFNFIYSFWGSIAITLIVSLFWVLAFECPFSRVEDYFLKDHYFNDTILIDKNNNTVPCVAVYTISDKKITCDEKWPTELKTNKF